MIERFEHHEVEGLRVGRFGGRINTTCILYRIGSTVIDTGPPNQWRAVRRFLRERRVKRIVVTHHHEDHGGNLAPIADEHGAAALAPADAVAPLESGFGLRPYQRLIWGRPERIRPEPLPEKVELPGAGALIPIATPGHSVDSTSFLEPERGWLFGGDLYISSRTRYLRADESVPAQIASLREVLELDFEVLFCAHRGVVADGKAALRRKAEALEELRGRVAELDARGLDAPAICRRLLGREGWMTWITGGHFSKLNLVRSCLGPGRTPASGELS